MSELKTTREIDNQIAARLFVNGAGQKAQRLVLELADGRDGGGWSEPAVVDQVVSVLETVDE